MDERGDFVTQQSAADPRKTIGMNGSGFIEMLARQMTADLQRIRDVTPPGSARLLDTKGVSFGVIARRADGSWITSGVIGLPAQSLQSSGPGNPPSLLVLPFAQSGNAVSLRVFTNSAYNQHIGIQSEERFGVDVDADGDGFANELTRRSNPGPSRRGRACEPRIQLALQLQLGLSDRIPEIASGVAARFALALR